MRPQRHRKLDPAITLRTVQSEEDIHHSAELVASALGSEEHDRVYALVSGGLRHCPFMRPERCFLMEASGRMIARVQLLDLSLQIDRTIVKAVGLCGLVIAPGYQARGLAYHLWRSAREHAREDGATLVMGFTGITGYYEHFAGTTVGPDYQLTFEAGAVAPAAERLREFLPADLPRLLAMYHESNVGRTGVLVRAEDRWPWLYRRSDAYLLGNSGYAGLRYAGPLTYVDEVAGDTAFFEALVATIAARGESNACAIQADVPPDHAFARYADRYGAKMDIRLRPSGGAMAKIINAPRLIKDLEPELSERYARAGPEGPGLRLSLVTEEETATCLLGPSSRRVRDLTVRVPESALTRLVFGVLPAATILTDAGVAASDEVISLLSILFPQGYPHTWRADRF